MSARLIDSIAQDLLTLVRDYKAGGRIDQLDAADFRSALESRLDVGLHQVKEDEPIFVLRATDDIGERTIKYWIAEAQREQVASTKRESAFKRLHLFQRWRERKIPD